jgi:predicted NBD/HSP70 family sugar kinase
MTLGLVNVVNLLGPQLLVLGDLLTVLPESVLTRIADEVRLRSLVSRAVGGIQMVSSALGADVKLLGAAEVAFEQVLDTV